MQLSGEALRDDELLVHLGLQEVVEVVADIVRHAQLVPLVGLRGGRGWELARVISTGAPSAAGSSG